MKRNKPHILVTNDDGVFAPGIKHLWQSLHEIADLTVIAPSKERSGAGMSLTLQEPLRVERVNWPNGGEVWSVSGTPADCVKLGFSVILERPVDMVVSGINQGTNSGRNILYSGTVAGAIEAVMHDIPGIAFSCYDLQEPNYAEVEKYVSMAVEYVLANPMAHGTLLNVNFPSKEHAEPKGFKMTRQGKEYWAENPEKRIHPSQGHIYYWLGGKLLQCDEDDDCDISWLNRGYMTAVPVYVAELTNHSHLDLARDQFESTMNKLLPPSEADRK